MGLYDLIGYSGTLNGLLSSLTVANAQSGFSYTFQNDAADGLIQLNIQAVPEPGTWMMLVLGLGALVMVARLRRSPREA